MATFDYKARDTKGAVVSGSLEAVSEDMVVSKLRDQGFFIIEILVKDLALLNLKIGFYVRCPTCR